MGWCYITLRQQGKVRWSFSLPVKCHKDYDLLLQKASRKKSRKHNKHSQWGVTSRCSYLFTFRETQTAGTEGTEIQFLSQRPQERTEERLYVSTKDGSHADFVPAMSICVFYHRDIRTRQWYLLLFPDFIYIYYFAVLMALASDSLYMSQILKAFV